MTFKSKKFITLLVSILLLAILAACSRQTPQEEEPTPIPESQYSVYDEYQEYYQDYYQEYYYDLNAPPTMLLPAAEGIHGLLSVVEYGNNRAYILGSIHIGRPSWYPLTPAAEAAMDRADVFAFEIDLGATGGPCLCDPDYCACGCEPDANDCICLLLDMMFLPDDITLSEFLPPEDYEIFMDYLSTFPIHTGALADYRPTTISELILYHVAAPMLGLSSEYSVDFYVFNRAQALGRPVVGLTDFNDHITFVSGMPDEYQFATARYFTDLETMLEEIEELAYIYETQDIATLTQMVTTDLAEAYEAYTVGELSPGGLALARYWHYTVGNYRSDFFARQIADLLTQTEEPTIFFVTVGIAHLTRELNVFHILRDMGFEVVGLH